jgi:hypothetical protein
MTVTIELPEAVQARLNQAAESRRVSAENLVLELLDEHLPPTRKDPKEFLAMLERWRKEASEEDPAEREQFFKMLDEDRTSCRKLFPDEMRGVTW